MPPYLSIFRGPWMAQILKSNQGKYVPTSTVNGKAGVLIRVAQHSDRHLVVVVSFYQNVHILVIFMLIAAKK